MAGYWGVIKREATTNEIENPSFYNNVTDYWGFAAGATGTRTWTTSYSKFGRASCEIKAGTGYARVTSAAETIADGDSVSVSVWMRQNTASHGWLVLQDTTTPGLLDSATSTTTGEWVELSLNWTNTTGGPINVNLWAQNQANDGTSLVWFDAAQMELKAYNTTYCDGTLDGCEWNGAPHDSTSSRSALSNAGGRVYDLRDLGFLVERYLGVGVPPVQNIDQEYAVLPGGHIQSQKIASRAFSLAGAVVGDDTDDLNAVRKTLIDVLMGSPVDVVQGPQKIILIYTGAGDTKLIWAKYNAGLEGNLTAAIQTTERVTVDFLADDPFFYGEGNESAALDTWDSASVYYAAARLRSTGQWSNLGMTTGVTGNVLVIAIDPNNGDVYYGTSVSNWNGNANNDYLIRYSVEDGAWENVGGAAAFNSSIKALEFAANGDLYIGGNFTNAGGIANADNLCKYVPSTDTLSAVGIPLTGAAVISFVSALKFDNSGLLYIGGSFINWNNIANADYITTWDGTSYAALSTGLSSTVNEIEISANDIVYVGGLFTVSGNYIATWDGSSFAALPGGNLNAEVSTMAINSAGWLYAGGIFTAAGATTLTRIGYFDGQQWHTMGDGLSNAVKEISISPDDGVWVGGSFWSEGELVRWNGSSWVTVDFATATYPTVYAIAHSKPDPVVGSVFSTWIGFTGADTATFSGAVTITNDGTQSARPKFFINRSGGNRATVKQIRNETTGKTLSLNYDLQDGETLTINCASEALSITSSYYGNVPSAMLQGSDFTSFELIPGENLITGFVDTGGAPTIVRWAEYTDTYRSFD